MAPMVELTGRVRLPRDYYVRFDGNGHSVSPAAIVRFVDWIATPALVAVTCVVRRRSRRARPVPGRAAAEPVQRC